ncbi:Uncharacterised protein [Mycobacteroides abscessus subsp. massiliense]|nr:Uncharacterised protein [Mycobacteroides abscessus subsp. massiliense]SKH93264.1 Uncharacterised protein [Mycobacteroides abscessus subsp. massiliense]SKI13301.1 Uncharacterised protein [Mycobacteroides abscessus subsp. massiliense]SKJ99638.1 Uncharacterised protein [Mycobacteroides abscessus subsp. massiliense]SKK28347.1 Uncharacterised protein [Mycobacteroides abscessus subsp. massiliense]
MCPVVQLVARTYRELRGLGRWYQFTDVIEQGLCPGKVFP